MGLFDRLFGGRFTAPPPEETNVSDAEILRELHPRPSPKQRKALRELVEQLLTFTPEDERQRLIRRVDRRFNKRDGAQEAFSEGLLDSERGQKTQHLALISCDWRGFDGFEYLAPIAVKNCGINEVYAYSHSGVKPMAEVLTDFDIWLAQHERRYLHFDSGGDDYLGAIVEAERVPEIIQLAGVAGLRASLNGF